MRLQPCVRRRRRRCVSGHAQHPGSGCEQHEYCENSSWRHPKNTRFILVCLRKLHEMKLKNLLSCSSSESGAACKLYGRALVLCTMDGFRCDGGATIGCVHIHAATSLWNHDWWVARGYANNKQHDEELTCTWSWPCSRGVHGLKCNREGTYAADALWQF
jgi:hypothetical protein